MSNTISGSVLLDLAFQEVIAFGNKAGPVTTRLREAYDLTNGTTDGSIDRAYAKREVSIGSAVTTVYDLVGSLTDTEGTTISAAEIVLIAVKNLSTTAANYLTVGPDATNGFGVVSSNKGFWADASDRNVIPADGYSWVVLHSRGGVPCSAGSTDELAVITQSGTSGNTWDLLVLARSA